VLVTSLFSTACSDSQPGNTSSRITSINASNVNNTILADAPAPVQRPVPAPVQRPVPAPVQTPAPAPVQTPSPAPVQITTPVPVQTTIPVRPAGSFNFFVTTPTRPLTEGDEQGLILPITVERIGGHDRDITISVDTTIDQQAQAIVIDSIDPILHPQSSRNIRLFLPIQLAPTMARHVDIRISANDRLQQFSIDVQLNLQPVPAPDIYLLIGQSNMVGNSQIGARNTSPGGLDELNPRIRQLNVRQNSEQLFSTEQKFTDPLFNVIQPTFVLAEDPLHEPNFPTVGFKEATHIGPGISFAKGILPFTSQDIILVPAAWSSSGFCRSENPLLGWNSENRDNPAFGSTLLLDRALTRLDLALTESGGIFRGILWHQGEADSNNTTCASSYAENLIDMISHIRTRARPDRRGISGRGRNVPIPFVIGTMSRGNDARGMFSLFSSDKQMVDDAHRSIQNILPGVTHVSADDLVPPVYPCGESSCVHFGATAYRELGFRYSQGMRRLQTEN